MTFKKSESPNGANAGPGKGVGQVEVSAAVAAVPVHIFSKHFFKKTKTHFAVIRVNINLIKMFYFKFYILGRFV